MRIIGGKDYYDTALAYGQDTDIVFVRHKDKTMEMLAIPQYGAAFILKRKDGEDWNVPHRLRRYPVETWRSNFLIIDDIPFYLVPAELWFCGVRYGGLKLCSDPTSPPHRYFWNFDDFLKFIDVCGTYLDTSRRQTWRWSRSRELHSQFDLVKRHFESQLLRDKEWFITNRISIATWNPPLSFKYNYVDSVPTGTTWRIDGDNLKEMEFFKRIDPYTAMQELSMWVGGVLPKDGNPVVEITDQEVKIHKAGFDKWSFRKMGKNSKP